MPTVLAFVTGVVVAALGVMGLAGVGPVRASVNPYPIVGDETPVTAMDLSAQPANNSPMLLADPTEARFVVLANRLDSPDFGCALQVSGDGGHSWAPSDPVPQLPAGTEKCYGPEVAFDRRGRLYYLFVGLAGPGNRPVGAFVATSDDHGRTFSAPHQVLGPLRFGVRMAIDGDLGPTGRMHLAWVEARSDVGLGALGAPPNPVMAAYSDDGGASFSDPIQVSDPTRSLVVAPALALGPHHRVHVVYYDLGEDRRDYNGLEGPVWDGRWSLVLATSSDGGGHFGPGRVVDDTVVAPERVMLIFTMPAPSVAIDGDRMCVAWTDAATGDPDAVLRCTPDGGRRWELRRRLNDVAQHRQYLPRLSVSPQGRLDAVFFDRRNDPENRRNDVYYTFSTDGGRHFAPNVRLTAEPSDSHIGPQYAGKSAEGQYEIGARLGLLSTSTGAVAAWPDMRNSGPTTRGQDIFAVGIDGLGANPQAPRWARALGLLGLVGGLGSAAVGLRRVRRCARVDQEARQ